MRAPTVGNHETARWESDGLCLPRPIGILVKKKMAALREVIGCAHKIHRRSELHSKPHTPSLSAAGELPLLKLDRCAIYRIEKLSYNTGRR